MTRPACSFCGRPCAKDVDPQKGCLRPKCIAARARGSTQLIEKMIEGVEVKDKAGEFLSVPEFVRRGVGAQHAVDELIAKAATRAELDALAGPPLGGLPAAHAAGRVLGNPPVMPRCRCGWPIPLIQFRLLAREDIAIKYELRFNCPSCGHLYTQGKRELEDLGTVDAPPGPGAAVPKLPPGR